MCRNEHIKCSSHRHMRWCCGLSLAGAATSIILIATKVWLSRQKKKLLRQKYFIATKPLSRQIFLATNIILSRQTRVCRYKTRLLSRQKYACHVKTFVATNTCLLRQRFVATKVLSRRAYFCRDKRRLLLWQRQVCRNKRQNICPDINYTCDSSCQW